MIKIRDISTKTLKLLCILIAVLFLASCNSENDGDGNKMVPDSSVPESESNMAAPSSISDTANAEGCIGCQILIMIYNATGEGVQKLYTAFTGAALPIVMVGFSIWLAWRILRFVSSVSESNVGEVWNEILRKLFVCMLCGFIAATPAAVNAFVNGIIFPIYAAFLELGLQILQNSGQITTGDSVSFKIFGETVAVQDANLMCELNGSIEFTNNGFPAGIRDTMTCMINVLRKYLTMGGDIAFKAMRNISWIGRLMGAIMWVMFFIVKIGFVFYLVDTIFKMGIIIIMLPLYIISYAFGPTRKWAGIGFQNILASSAFMMCFSVIISLCLVSMVSLVQNNPQIFDPTEPEVSMSEMSIGFMCLLMISFLIYGSMGVSQQLVSGFIGAQIGTSFQRNLKKMVQGIGSAVLKGLAAALTFGISKLPTTQYQFVNNILQAVTKGNPIRAKLNRWAGRE